MNDGSGLSRYFASKRLLTGTDHSPLTRERLSRTNVPIVEIWDLTDDPIHSPLALLAPLLEQVLRQHLLEQFLCVSDTVIFRLLARRRRRGRTCRRHVEMLRRTCLRELLRAWKVASVTVV